MQNEKLNVKIKIEDAARGLEMPHYQTCGSVGMDLCAAIEESQVIEPGNVSLISTGLRMSIPPGYEAQIRPRSGLALKHRIGVLNTPGTIDSDYRGIVGVILFNFGKKPFTVNRGDRIAQMVFNKVAIAAIELVDDIDQTERGDGGFGHTGE